MQSSSLWKALLVSFYVVRGAHALPAVRDSHNVTARVPPPQGLTIPLQWQGPGWFPSITMQVGSDPNSHGSKTFNMLPDTGSSSFWVVSDSASSTIGLGPATSETFEAMVPSTWDTVYGHALKVEGTVGKDFVTFAGRPPLKMNIGLVQRPPSTFNDIDGYAGIFGFAVSGDSTGPNHARARTPFRQLVDSGTISAITGWKYPTSPGTEGQVTLGWFDPAHSQPGTDVTVQTVDEQYHEDWMVAVASLKVGNKDVKMRAPITALLDTGCVGLMTPPFESIGLLKAIGATYSKIERQWTVPCSTNVVVSFEIGGKLFSAQGTDIIGTPLSDSRDCRPRIGEDQTLKEGLWIIGSTFLHNWHIVLDGTKNPQEITIARASQ